MCTLPRGLRPFLVLLGITLHAADDSISVDITRSNLPNISGDDAPEVAAQNRMAHPESRDRGEIDVVSGLPMIRRSLLGIRGARSAQFVLEWDPLNNVWDTGYNVRLFVDPPNREQGYIAWGGSRGSFLQLQSDAAGPEWSYSILGQDYRYQKVLWKGLHGGEVRFRDQSKYLFEPNDSPPDSTDSWRGRLSAKVDRHGRQIVFAYEKPAGGPLSAVTEPVSGHGIYMANTANQDGELHHVYDDLNRNVFLRYQVNRFGVRVLTAISNPFQGNAPVRTVVTASPTKWPVTSVTASWLNEASQAFVLPDTGTLLNTRVALTMLNPDKIALVVDLIAPSGDVLPIYDSSGDATITLQKTVSLPEWDQWITTSAQTTSGTWKLRYYSRTSSSPFLLQRITVNHASVTTATCSFWPADIPTSPGFAWTTYAYDQRGRLESEKDPDGRLVFMNVYDDYGRVVKQFDGTATKAREFAYSWDGKFLVTRVTDRLGNTQTYTHNENYQLIRHTDELGNQTSFTYDSLGNRTSIVDALGRTTVFGYDEAGNVISTTRKDPSGKVVDSRAMTYDSSNNLLSTKEDSVLRATFEYDAKNNLTKRIQTGQSLVGQPNAAARTTAYTYDANSLPLTMVRPGGGTTTNTYVLGQLTQSQTEGIITSYEYDGAGRMVSKTFGGKRTSYTYSPKNELLQKDGPLVGQMVQWEYDGAGHVVQHINARGFATQFEYDVNGLQISKTDAMVSVTHYGYDAEGRLTSITDPPSIQAIPDKDHPGFVTRYAYDAAGRPLAVTNPVGSSMRVEYDKVGNVIAVYDAYGVKVVSSQYDALNRQISSTDALNRTTRVDYDLFGRVVSVTNARNLATRFAYDGLDQLATTIAPLAEVSCTYDTDGNLTSVENGYFKDKVNWDFDRLGRPTREKFGDFSSSITEYPLPSNVISYEYDDPRGLLTKQKNARLQVATLEYDDAGQLSTIVDPVGTIRATYDLNGNVLTVQNGDGGPVSTFEYDSLDRLVRFTDERGEILEYEYDEVGNLTRLTYPGGSFYVDYSYDPANRMSRVEDSSGHRFEFSYDKNGRIITEARSNGTWLTRRFDRMGQLLNQSDFGPGGINLARYDFRYDTVGNVLSESSTSAVSANMGLGIASGGNVKMTYRDGHRLATFNGQTVQFDMDGNMTQGPVTASTMGTFVCDSRNRLISAPGVSYIYDAMNRLKTITRSSGEVEHLVIDPLTQNVLVRRDHSTASSKFMIYGPGLLAESGTFAYRCYHYDLRGNTVLLTDETGANQDTFQYDPYGEVIAHNGAPPSPALSQAFLFSGRSGVMRQATGLHYMRDRFYSTVAHRFVNRDKYPGSLAVPQSLNRYAYVEGNPINRIDPMGFKWMDSSDSGYAGPMRGRYVVVDVAVGKLGVTVGTRVGYDRLNDNLVGSQQYVNLGAQLTTPVTAEYSNAGVNVGGSYGIASVNVGIVHELPSAGVQGASLTLALAPGINGSVDASLSTSLSAGTPNNNLSLGGYATEWPSMSDDTIIREPNPRPNSGGSSATSETPSGRNPQPNPRPNAGGSPTVPVPGEVGGLIEEDQGSSDASGNNRF